MTQSSLSSVPVAEKHSEKFLGVTTEQWLGLWAVGLLAVFVIRQLAGEVWASEAASYGPLVLVTCLWLIGSRLIAVTETQPPFWKLAFALLIAGAPALIIGYGLQILSLQVVALVLALLAYVAGFWGLKALRLTLFPILLLLFISPLPAGWVAAITIPMKLLISYLTEEILYSANYQIARDGVILQVGPYMLMVADACAGLQTLFSLEALGLLYLNIVRSASLVRNIAMAILIVPISVTANLLRVLVLVLITYHWGDAAGQGYLHDFAGLFLFVVALFLIIAVDFMLRRLLALRNRNG